MTEKKEEFTISEPKGRSKVPPSFQAALIAVSVIFLTIGYLTRLAYFQAADQPIEYEAVNPTTLRKFGGFPERIEVGLNIERFQEFNVIKNKFNFTGNIWFELDAGSVSLETLENFKFDRGNILYRSPPKTLIIENRLLVRYLVRVEFNSGLNFSSFPLDDHKVNLVLTHPFLSPEEVLFETKAVNFSLEANLQPFGWRPVSKSVKSGFISSNLTETEGQKTIYQPVVGFSIAVERYGVRYSLAILLPLLLIFYIMLFSLSVEVNPSVTIASGGITSILAYRFVIEQLSPISGDLMISDKFFFLVLGVGIFIFFVNKVDLYFYPIDMRIRKSFIGLIHIFVAILSAALLIP